MSSTGKNRWTFQQDNNPKHKSKVDTAFFTKKQICVLPWPPSSPNLNIIKHVWDQLDLLIQAWEQLPCNWNEMQVAFQEEWKKFSQDLYESMSHQIEAVIKARGGNTKYQVHTR